MAWVTMTASTTHCWKSARLDWLALLLCACLCWAGTQQARAQAVTAEVTQFQLERTAEGSFLSATVRFELPTSIEDALLKGVPMFFVAELEVFRERWYWYDRKVLAAERHIRLAYQPLTRRWRLNIASGAITNNSLGLSLNQSFDNLPDALAAVQRVSRWKIAEPGELDPEQRHNLEYNFRLDVSQLPRPFQIGVLGQSDWNISASIRQRIGAEGAR